MHPGFRRFILLNLFTILIILSSGSIEVVSSASISLGQHCTDTLINEANRDKQKPIIPLREDRRARSSYVVNAHEIIRKGLEEFLEFKEADLGTYLSYIVDESNITFVDEYGEEILSYYKIFSFIWRQYNEIVCENYAVNQFDKDKLDLCSVARFLSHQPAVKDRQTIMKRMGDALRVYRCHPCTLYKRKEYGETVAPNTDDIDPEGVSPEDGLVLCRGYSNHRGERILLPSTSLTTTTSSTTTSTTTTTTSTTTMRPSTQEPVCQQGQYLCGDRQRCVNTNRICDGEKDENSCSKNQGCKSDQYQCANQRCVQKSWLCDGDNDCGDNSDENGCRRTSPTPPDTTTWLSFNCNIRNTGENSYDKSCDEVEVKLADVERIRKMLGPEMNPSSPVKTIPFGYKMRSLGVVGGGVASSLGPYKEGKLLIVHRTENYCL